MKSQRRHELQTNDLAKGVAKLPDATRQYGTRVLLVVTLVVAVVFFFYYRSNSQKQAAAQEARMLQEIRNEVISLQQLRSLMDALQTPGGDPGAQAVELTRKRVDAIRQALAQLNDSLNPKILAGALQARGDLNLFLANTDDVPQATTRPELALSKLREGAIATAEESYQTILQNYPDQLIPAAAAHFGLASIAENQAKWDDARTHYQALVDNAKLPSALSTIAKRRLESLGKLDKRYFVSTQPATRPVSYEEELIKQLSAATQPDEKPVLQAPMPPEGPLFPVTQPAATLPIQTQPAATQPAH